MNDFIKRRRLWATRREWGRTIGFVLFEKQGDRIAHSTILPMYMPGKEEDGQVVEPSFYLEQDETQQLMDNLWELGFRPSEGTGSAGALSATQKHLEDMRKIVFDYIGIISK